MLYRLLSPCTLSGPLLTLDGPLRRRLGCCRVCLSVSSVSVSSSLPPIRMGNPGYSGWGDPGPHEAAQYYDAEAPPSGYDAWASLPPRRKKRSGLPCLVALLLLVLAGTAAGVLFGVVRSQDRSASSSPCVVATRTPLTAQRNGRQRQASREQQQAYVFSDERGLTARSASLCSVSKLGSAARRVLFLVSLGSFGAVKPVIELVRRLPCCHTLKLQDVVDFLDLGCANATARALGQQHIDDWNRWSRVRHCSVGPADSGSGQNDALCRLRGQC